MFYRNRTFKKNIYNIKNKIMRPRPNPTIEEVEVWETSTTTTTTTV